VTYSLCSHLRKGFTPTVNLLWSRCIRCHLLLIFT